MLFIIYLSYIFLIWPLLEARAEIKKYFRWFLVQMKILEFAFEINWPLPNGIRNFCSLCIAPKFGDRTHKKICNNDIMHYFLQELFLYCMIWLHIFLVQILVLCLKTPDMKLTINKLNFQEICIKYFLNVFTLLIMYPRT